MVAGFLEVLITGASRPVQLEIDTVRLVYVLVSLFSAGFPGLLVYVVLWAVVPEEE